GSKQWQPDGLNPIRLVTSNPPARSSVFCDNATWINCTTPVNVTEASVSTGDVGNFNFNIIIPENNTAVEQTYNEYFNLTSEGMVVLNDPGQHWIINVLPQ
ncbi:MAG: hypothetical protein AAB395_02140, partial [Patescibacteria group bacterium]